MTDMIDGYWHATPGVTLRYSPQLDTWWVEVIDSNDSEFIENWIEDVDNSKYENNGFLYKSIWGANYDDRDEALHAVEALSSLFRSMKKREYLILGKIDENHVLASKRKDEDEEP